MVVSVKFKLSTLIEPLSLDDLQIISETARELLLSTEPVNVRVRLLGISISNFGEILPKPKKLEQVVQLKLF